MSSGRSLIEAIQKPFGWLTQTALVAMVVITAADVIGRVVFGTPLGFAYELIGLLLGAAVYGGLVRMNWERDHIRIDLIENQLAQFPRFDGLRDKTVWLLELVFFALLAVFMGRQALAMQRWQETFLFLPLEKWVPLALYTGFAAIATVATFVAIIPSLKYKARKPE